MTLAPERDMSADLLRDVIANWGLVRVRAFMPATPQLLAFDTAAALQPARAARYIVRRLDDGWRRRRGYPPRPLS